MKRTLTLGYDFNNGIKLDAVALRWKLAREDFGADDSLLMLAWSTSRETIAFSKNVTIELLSARMGRVRILYDLAFIVVAPYLARKRHFKPDTITITDFPLVWAAYAVKLMCGGSIELRLNGLPRALGKTRGQLHGFYHAIHEFFGKRIPDRCIAINGATREYLLVIGVPEERIQMRMPDVITPDLPFIAAAKRGVARRELGIPQDAPILLSVGRLETEKAYDDLLRGFALLPSIAYLVIIGEGSLRRDLEQLAGQLHLTDRVKLIGNRPRETIWNYYKDADCFALISKSEALGMSLMEAMYAGVPAVGRPIGGIAESIGQNGKRGFLWNRDDGYEKLATLIERCFAKDEEIAAMTDRARTHVLALLGHKADTEKK